MYNSATRVTATVSAVAPVSHEAGEVGEYGHQEPGRRDDTRGCGHERAAQPNGCPEPSSKRAITFVDGQNLYRSAKDTFGCSHPNYDVGKLSRVVCERAGLILCGARFYTGVPDARDNPEWHDFWSRKLLSMNRQGVRTFSRSLRYRDEVIPLKGGTLTRRRAREKGIDVRMAIDLIRSAHRDEYDMAVVFSQDQDLSEVALELRRISREQGRWIQMISAFPYVPAGRTCRGIAKTTWFRIDRELYNSCIDTSSPRLPGDCPRESPVQSVGLDDQVIRERRTSDRPPGRRLSGAWGRLSGAWSRLSGAWRGREHTKR